MNSNESIVAYNYVSMLTKLSAYEINMIIKINKHLTHKEYLNKVKQKIIAK